MTNLSAHLTFIMDPGHGWLRVPLNDIVALGLEEQISPYSFIEDGFAFLEEDCDCPCYLQTLEEQGFPRPVIENRHVERFARPVLRFGNLTLDSDFWQQWRR